MKSETHDISSIFHSDMQRKSVRFLYRLFQYSEVPKSFRRVFSALLRMVRLPLLQVLVGRKVLEGHPGKKIKG